VEAQEEALAVVLEALVAVCPAEEALVVNPHPFRVADVQHSLGRVVGLMSSART
jgi:hypothetical protein